MPAQYRTVSGSNEHHGRTFDGRRTGIVKAANEHAQGTPEGKEPVCATTDATAAVRFAIGGMLRFLSHAETLRVFQRACARARLSVKFTEGFNPHPKLSLPLPRPVGVEAADELLVLRLFDERGIAVDDAEAAAREQQQNRMREALAATLPEQIALRSVTLRKSNASFVPEAADYVFAVRSATGDVPDRLEQAVASLLARDSVIVERVAPGRRPGRRIDVRGFLESIRVDANVVVATCIISTGGSIRVDEIMQLLGLTVADLAGPVRRDNVAWKTT